MTITRRELLKGTIAGGAVVAAGGLNVIGCAPVDVPPEMKLEAVGSGQIVVPLAKAPSLTNVGGAVTVRVTKAADATFSIPKGGVLVIRRSATEYVAVQADCPHLACPLGYSPSDDRIKCPCHPSVFLTSPDAAKAGSCAGTVIHGPALSSLATWPAAFDAGANAVEVDLTRNACADDCPPVVAGTVTFPLSAVPELMTVGGTRACSPSGLTDQGIPGRIILRRVDATTVSAVSAVCNHKQCYVEARPTELVCPCHDSRFDFGGKVTKKNAGGEPQGEQLATYAATLTADSIVVKVS